MSDLKSRLPDFKELISMGSKLFKGIKNSVDEIVHDYKEKRKPKTHKKPAAETKSTKSTSAAHVKKETTATKEPKEKN